MFGDAIAKAKEFRAALAQLAEAYKAGKEDEAARLGDQLREKRLPLVQYTATLPTYAEIDQAETLQVERGRDNADLDARYQRIIDLLNKRLESAEPGGRGEPRNLQGAPGPAGSPSRPRPPPRRRSRSSRS